MATFIDDEGQFIALEALVIQLKSGGAAQHPASHSAFFKALTDADLLGNLSIEQILDYCISIAEHAFPSGWADIAREALALGRALCRVAMIWENTQEVLRFGSFRARLIMQAIAFAIGKPGVAMNSRDAAELANLTAQVGSGLASCIDNVGPRDVQMAGKEKQAEWWSTLVSDMRRNQHALKDTTKHSPVANTDAATTPDVGADAAHGADGPLSQFQVKLEANGGEGDGGVLACDGGSNQPGSKREPDAPKMAKKVQVLVTETVNLASCYRFRMSADEDPPLKIDLTSDGLRLPFAGAGANHPPKDGIELGELYGAPFYVDGNASLFSEIAPPARVVKVVESDSAMEIYWRDLQLNMSAPAPPEENGREPVH
ncbi:unnamed protein product, partial [Prorocentrum cordatum]